MANQRILGQLTSLELLVAFVPWCQTSTVRGQTYFSKPCIIIILNFEVLSAPLFRRAVARRVRAEAVQIVQHASASTWLDRFKLRLCGQVRPPWLTLRPFPSAHQFLCGSCLPQRIRGAAKSSQALWSPPTEMFRCPRCRPRCRRGWRDVFAGLGHRVWQSGALQSLRVRERRSAAAIAPIHSSGLMRTVTSRLSGTLGLIACGCHRSGMWWPVGERDRNMWMTPCLLPEHPGFPLAASPNLTCLSTPWRKARQQHTWKRNADRNAAFRRIRTREDDCHARPSELKP